MVHSVRHTPCIITLNNPNKLFFTRKIEDRSRKGKVQGHIRLI